MDKNYSVLLYSRLPSYIKDDPSFSQFISFFENYYTWFNDTYDIAGFGDKIDIDANYDLFLPYFQADFLPYFPDEITTDKIKLLKIVKELYKAKGVPDSFKFLFRAIYNSYCEVTPTRDFVFKASEGKWIVPKSIKIKSTDFRFLNIQNLRILGVQSKTIGIAESSKLVGNRIQIYLSNIERLFFSGEEIKLLDSNNKEVYFLNGEIVEYDTVPPAGSEALSSKIIGSISNVDILSDYRGQRYKIGDPVAIIGGLNPNIENPIGAKATVSEITTGQITGATILNGGYGFSTFPDSIIDVIYNNEIDTVADCNISLVDETKPANTSYFPIDTVANNLTVMLSNTFNFSVNATINVNSTLANSFLFTSFSTYPITDIIVVNGGGGYETSPTLTFSSLVEDTENVSQNLKDFGILAPIQIINSGIGYTSNDTIIILGGDGDWAFAQINSVNVGGSITSVEYYENDQLPYTVGGMGYSESNLPSIQIISGTGSNAELIVPGILGSGVEYDISTSKVGAITKISLSENGEDYIQTPNVSLRVQDIAISNVTSSKIENCVVYQGTGLTPVYSTFIANVESYTQIGENLDSTIYSLRVYDYRGEITPTSKLKLFDTVTSELIDQYDIESSYSVGTFINGVKIYGDGSAKAQAKFLNGLIIGDGKYLNTDGQASAYSILQSDIYNSSTYFLSSEKDYDSYKEVVFGLTHPLGSRLVPRNLLRSTTDCQTNSSSHFYIGTPNTVSIEIVTSPNNLIQFSDKYLVSSNLSYFSENDSIFIETQNDMNVYSTITNIDEANSIFTLLQPKQYKFSNLYSGFADSNTVTITQEHYPETKYGVNTFIYVGDSIRLSGNDYPIINRIDNTLQFIDDIELISGITRTFISRASSANYINSNGSIQTAAIDTARYSYDPFNLLVDPKLLLEPSSTNLLTYSQRFANASWLKISSSVASNMTTAPDGTLTADTWIEDTSATTQKYIIPSLGTVVAGTYTMSCFVKAASGTRYFVMEFYGGTSPTTYRSIFNVSSGAVTFNYNGAIGSIVPYGNGWYRCIMTATVTSTVSSYFYISNSSTSVAGYTGDGTSGLYIWGAQLEAGSSVTSYISSVDTFTSRNSIGTYINANCVIKIAPVNTARYSYDPANILISPDLLLENAANNLFTYTENFDKSIWIKSSNTTIQTDSTFAPDGTLTADRINFSSIGQFYSNTTTVSANTQYTFSYWVKLGTKVSNKLAIYDVTHSNFIVSSTVQTAANSSDWTRVSKTFTTPSGCLSIRCYADSCDSSPTDNGYNFIWGAQLEQGVEATSYISSVDTFISRNSTGTYVDSSGIMRIASANTARYNYTGSDLTLNSKILLENAGTNLLTYSEQFDNSDWSKSNTAIISNITTAPDGTLTADKVIPDFTSAQHLVDQNIGAVSIGDVYTFSVFVKAAELDEVAIYAIGEEYKSFNLSTGTITNGTVSSTSIVPVGNDWYRLSGTFTKSNTSGVFYILGWKDGSGDDIFVGDNSSGFYIWGTQVELNSFATSYIPSTVSFTSRSSSATYIDANGIIKTASTNTARYTYNPSNLTLSSKLLLENAGTNLLTYSEQFENNAVWNVITNISISSNTTFSPSGTYTADEIRHTSTSDFGRTSMAISSGSEMTFSIFVKRGCSPFCKLKLSNGSSSISQWFNLNNIEVASNSKTGTEIFSPISTIIDMGNDWVRVALTVSTTGITSLDLGFASCDSDLTQPIYNSYSYIWGAQLETGFFATSYIATTTSQVTRNVDISSSTQGIRVADISSSNTGNRAADISSSTLTTQNFTIVKSLSSNTTIIKYSLLV